MGDPSHVFGFYVEKENIGKRIKSSKVRVTWKLCCLPNLKLHEVELKHSVFRGPMKLNCLRRIKVDSELIFQNKVMFNNDFKHDFVLEGHLLSLTIRYNMEHTYYDLKIDGVAFHKLRLVSSEQLEAMRKPNADMNKILGTNIKLPKTNKNVKEEDDFHVTTMKFEDFVRGGDSVSNDKKDNKKSNKNNKKDDSNSDSEEDLLWNSGSSKKQYNKERSVSWTNDPFVHGNNPPIDKVMPSSIDNHKNINNDVNEDISTIVEELKTIDFASSSYSNIPSYPTINSFTTTATTTTTNPFVGTSTYNNTNVSHVNSNPYTGVYYPPQHDQQRELSNNGTSAATSWGSLHEENSNVNLQNYKQHPESESRLQTFKTTENTYLYSTPKDMPQSLLQQQTSLSHNQPNPYNPFSSSNEGNATYAPIMPASEIYPNNLIHASDINAQKNYDNLNSQEQQHFSKQYF